MGSTILPGIFHYADRPANGMKMVIDNIIKIALLPVVVAQAILPQAAAEFISPNCLFTLLFDIECFGCGMGRALTALLHLEWQRAMALNRLSPLVLLVLIALFIFTLKDLFHKNKFPVLAD